MDTTSAPAVYIANRKGIIITVDELGARYAKESLSSIAESLGVTAATVFNWLRKHNVDSSTLAEISIKRVNTNLARYGTTHPMHLREVAASAQRNRRTPQAESVCKREKTMRQRYGVGNPQQLPATRIKTQETNLVRFGQTHHMKNPKQVQKVLDAREASWGTTSTLDAPGARDKFKNSNLLAHGVEHPMQNKQVQGRALATWRERYASGARRQAILDTRIATMQERYGVDFALSSAVLRMKSEATCLARYGVRNYQQSSGARAASSAAAYTYALTDERCETARLLREDTIWGDIAVMSIAEVAKKYQVNRATLHSALLEPRYRERFASTYTYPSESAPESELYDEVVSMLPGHEVLRRNRSILGGLELDIAIPHLAIAIEFNGTYWHSESAGKARRYHIDKTCAAAAVGWEVIHVFEHQWVNRKAQLLGYLKARLGANSRRVGANKCSLVTAGATAFFESTHLQGASPNTLVEFQLQLGGACVGALALSRHHRQGHAAVVILSRLCFHKDISVIGGAARLLKAAAAWASAAGYSEMRTWSDSSLTSGGLYASLGFLEDAPLPPDYFYVDPDGDHYVSKQSQKKSVSGCPADHTEFTWAAARGLLRTWDCGKRVWRLPVPVPTRAV